MKTIIKALIFLFTLQQAYSSEPSPTFEYFIKKQEGKVVYVVQGNQKNFSELKKALNLPDSHKNNLLVRLNLDDQIKHAEVQKQLLLLKKLKFKKAEVFQTKKDGTINITPVDLTKSKVIIPETKN